MSGDEAAVIVEVDEGEDFVGELGESGNEVIRGDSGGGEAGASADSAIETMAGGGHDFI